MKKSKLPDDVVSVLIETSKSYRGIADFEATGENMTPIIHQIRGILERYGIDWNLANAMLSRENETQIKLKRLIHRLESLGEYVKCDAKFFMNEKSRIGIVIDKSPDGQLLKIKSVEHPKLFSMSKSNVIFLQNIDEAPEFILLKNPKSGKRFWTKKITG